MELNPNLPQKLTECKSVPTRDHAPLHRIANEVAQKHGLTLRHMRARCRYQSLVAMRYEYFYRAAAETSKSFRTIARLVGVDHSTVGYGMSRYALQYKLPVPRVLYRKASLHVSSAIKSYPRSYYKLAPWERRRLLRTVDLEFRVDCVHRSASNVALSP